MGKKYKSSLVAFLTSDMQKKINELEHGFANGYVAIPKSCSLYNKIINNIDLLKSVNIHGDITYCNINEPSTEYITYARPNEKLPEEALYIGFDTFHIGDNIRNWNFARCMKEVIKLRTQLENL